MLVLCLSFGTYAAAQSSVSDQRSIIAISNPSSISATLASAPPRAVAETPLNYLGMTVVHYDWSVDGAPADDVVDASRGALVWFVSDELDNREAFMQWAIEYMRSGRYIVLAGEMGFIEDGDVDPLTREFLDLLGISYTHKTLGDFEPLTVAYAAENFANYEQQLPRVMRSVVEVDALGPEAEPLLTLVDNTGRDSDVVAITQGGGIILAGYGMVDYVELGLGFWMTDPFAFFRKAFRTERRPVADTTTLVGRRIYYSHIDGDGWNSVATVPNENGMRTICAEILFQHVIKRYPGLPVTVGPVTADLDLNMFGSQQARHVAKQIFAANNVEIATHTHTHPFDWGFYRPDRYNQAVDQVSLAGVSPVKSAFDHAFDWISGLMGEDEVADVEPYKNEDFPLPRAYYDGPFQIADDLEKSIRIAESLAPAGKQVEIVLWSGNLKPFESALSTARQLGLENMNGGFTRLDDKSPSVSGISPLAERVGDELQVYSSMNNEADYTEFWTTRFYGFRDLISTIDRSEAPIRLLPINVYYHMYAVDRPVALDALQDVMDHVSTQTITPITASHFAKIVRGMHAAKIERSENGWRVSERVELNTIRFDDVSADEIDIDRSIGLLGLTSHNGSLYLALDPAISEAFIALTDQPLIAQRPFLVDSRWPVKEAKFENGNTRFQIQGFGSGEMNWRMPVACEGQALVQYANGSSFEYSVATDFSNDLQLRLTQAPTDGASVDINCVPSGLG